MIRIASAGPAMDRIAVAASAICAIHCLALPLLLGVFPALGASFFGQEQFHWLLLWLVIPLSLVSLTLGCRRHKNPAVALFGLAGLGLLTLTATIGHDVLGETGERIVTVTGALAIAVAHTRNFILCRRADCAHDAEALPPSGPNA